MKILSNRIKGIIFVILSAFGFATMSVFVKLSGNVPPLQKIFIKNFVSLFISFILIMKTKQRWLGKRKNQVLLILRSVLGTAAIALNYYAIDHMVLSDASMLNKLSLFFIIIFSAVFLREKIKLNQIISFMIAFAGTLFVVQPSFNSSVIPSLIAVIGGLLSAGAYTCVRALGGKEEPHTIVFYFSFCLCIMVFPFVLRSYTYMSKIQIVFLMLAGVFASLGQFAITYAYKYAAPKEISIFDYSNIVFAAMFSFTIWGKLPNIMSFLGYGLIFMASLYMFIYNKKLDGVR